tara:strand:+ start:2487 stop:3629 length:1143 start_codon:yes stop_codon:yes gene_type:complete
VRTIRDIDTNGSLENALVSIQGMAARKQDYLVDTNQLQFASRALETAQPVITMEQNHGEPTRRFAINDVCFDQIVNEAGIPVQYARRLLTDYPNELEDQVMAIWNNENKTRMLRTYEGTYDNTQREARAWVSNKFKTFDNTDMVETVIQPLIESEAQWEAVNTSITDKRMYLQFKSRRSVAEPALGDLMALGLRITNSETGHGSVNINQMIFTLACLNGMQTAHTLRSIRRPHLGRRRDNEGMNILIQEDTIAAQNQALKLEVRDIMQHVGDEQAFQETIQQMRIAHNREIEGTPQEAVERIGEILKLTKQETSSVLDGLIETFKQPGYTSGKISQATLVNSVTAIQHKAHDDDKGNWQRMGGKILELPRTQWEYIARAA